MGKHSGKYDMMATDDNGEIINDGSSILAIESEFYKQNTKEKNETALESRSK